MTALTGFRHDLDDSLAMSRAYLRSYWFWGFITVLMTTVVTGWVPLLLLGIATVVISSLWIFPGAMLINLAGLRWFRSRAWDADAPIAFVAGLLSLPLVWGTLFMVIKLQIGPPAGLKNALGHDLAWMTHGVGTMIVGSSSSVAIGWALSPPSPTAATPR
jgi:hypothetical protein